MQCQEAKSYVSVLHDGEPVPSNAAEHIRGCAACRARLRDYAELAAELRLLASQRQEVGAPLPAALTARPARGWRRALAGRILIPRYAFFLAVVAAMVLSVGLVEAQKRLEGNPSREFHLLAVRMGDAAKVADMLQQDPSLANSYHEGQAPLHRVGSRPFVDEETWAVIAQLLLAAGADPNARTYGNRTPLHEMAGTGKVQLVSLLLANGADVNASDDHGRTPLDFALMFGPDSDEVAQVLLAQGARMDIFAMVSLGKTDDLRELLPANPALANAKTRDGFTPLQLAALRRQPEAVDLLRVYTPLPDILTAAAVGDRARVQELLDSDESLVRAHDADFKTPLYWAAACGQLQVAEILLERGADPNGTTRPIPGAFGESWETAGRVLPLQAAVSAGDLEMVQLLLRHGADPKLQSGPGGASPYHRALRMGRKDIAEELLRHM